MPQGPPQDFMPAVAVILLDSSDLRRLSSCVADVWVARPASARPSCLVAGPAAICLRHPAGKRRSRARGPGIRKCKKPAALSMRAF